MIKQKRFDWFFVFAVFLALVGIAFNNAFYRSIKAQDDVGDVTTEVASLGPREIILVRNNLVVGTYGGNRTSSDLGASLVTAMAACQDGDVLYTGAGQYEVESLVIDDEITWVGGQATMIPSDADWDSLVNVTADDVTIRDLRCDGQSSTNAGDGNGILVAFGADRVRLIDCVTDNCYGNSDNEGRGVYINGIDCEIDGLHAEGNKYAGIRASNTNNLTIRRSKLINNGIDPVWSRSIELDNATTDIDAVHIIDTFCFADTSVTRAFINFNLTSAKLVVLENVKIVNRDNISAGVSFNNANREQCVKFQNADQVLMHGCSFLHGDNSGSGTAVGWAFDATIPTSVRAINCVLSGGLANQSRVEQYYLENVWFGTDIIPDNVLVQGLPAGRVTFNRCNFNVRDGVRAFTINSGSPVAGDYFHVIDCDFKADKGTDVNVADDAGPGLVSRPRRMVFVGNTYTNDGAGAFDISTTDDLYLMMHTDRNGNMMYDASDGNMPAPGAGPTNFFTAVPGVEDGQRIINEEYNGSGTKYWVYNGSNWIVGDS